METSKIVTEEDLGEIPQSKSKGSVFENAPLEVYDGQKAKIALMETVDYEDHYFWGADKKSHYDATKSEMKKKIRVTTEVVVERIVLPDGIEIKNIPASEDFPLTYNPEEKRWELPSSPKARLVKLLKLLNVTHPKQLFGKEVMVLCRKWDIKQHNPDGTVELQFTPDGRKRQGKRLGFRYE